MESRRYGRGYRSLSMGGLKFWVGFSSVFAIIGAISSLVYLIYILLALKNVTTASLSASEVDFFVNQLGLPYLWLLIVISLSYTVGQLMSSVLLIRFVFSNDEEEVISNRYILAVLSLGIGGIFLPFMLGRLPNTNVSTTIAPRYLIGKYYGILAFCAGLSGVIGSLIMTFSLRESDPILNNGLTTEQINLITFITMGVFGLVLLFGIVSMSLFLRSNAATIWNEKSSSYGLMSFISYISLVTATIVLCLVIINSILEILNAVSSMFDTNKGVLERILSVFLLSITLLVQGFIIYTTAKTIKGIWSKEDQINYSAYAKLNDKFAMNAN